MYFSINSFFVVIFEDSDGQLNMGEFGLMMKTYWLMKVPGLKIQEFLVGPEREKWENLCKEFNERQQIKELYAYFLSPHRRHKIQLYDIFS